MRLLSLYISYSCRLMLNEYYGDELLYRFVGHS